MPDFEIEGNPGNIRSKAITMEQKGQLFYDTGDALSKIDVSGWTGRAADEFREAHDLEPERWYKSGNGFKKAAAGLQTYAGELESAQSRADWAREEYERGQRESESARTQYSSYMDQMRSYWAGGGTDQAQPFNDWGAPIQQDALRELDAAKADLDNAAHLCAGEVRAGCADAPEEPNWLESGLTFVGGILEGAGEAVWDLLTMVPFSPVNMVIDAYKLATGDITPEELMKKYELSAENAWDMAQGIYTGLTTDPIGFGKELGKSLLDWDTWADDPARAIGHLVPDAIAAVATAGTGALATRGAKGTLDVLDGLSDLNKLDNISDLNKLDDLGGLNRLDDLGDLGGATTRLPDAEYNAIRLYTGSSYDEINSFLRGTDSPIGVRTPEELAEISDNISRGLDRLPPHEGVTYRGTNLPDSILDDIEPGGRYSDPAFSSTSESVDVAQNFRSDGNALFHIDGSSGRDIQHISVFDKTEAEVLFDKGHEFTVVDKVWNADGGYWDIYLKD